MKRSTQIKAMAISTVLLAALVAPAMADVDWKLVPFSSIIGGGFSYDASGDDVVLDTTTAFRIAMGDILSVQKIGNDQEDNPVTGNCAFFGVFSYADPNGVFAWASNNPSTPFALELGAHPLLFKDTATGFEFSDYFALDARPGTDYLTATFAELGAWGCTEIADGVWMDIAVDPIANLVALSVIMQGMNLGEDDVDATILAGNLDGETSNWRASGMRVAPIPAPGAVVLGMIGFGLVGWVKRRFA